MKNPWKLDPNRQKNIEEQNKVMLALRNKALECLNDEKFQEYQGMFAAYEKDVIEAIINLNEEEPIKYAFKVRQLVDTLKAYRLFCSSVEEDANRRIQE